ncbi:glycosyltransferase [Ornithinimicrobium pratense]|uniref:glycosyltransferase n=1 Tax=Ornithinimicrobium pratense TaxID=2593973 RepID=UPI00192DA4AD|nr:glycosyltransferase [Ornithinimicrobium pratense]
MVLWGQGGDPLSAEDIDGARAATPGWEWTVRGGGFPPAADLAAELCAADVVVTHAGQGSVADVAWARRPAVVLAQPRPYEEQAATVHALDRLGLAAVGYGWPRDHRWPELLEQALGRGGEGWSAWGADGAVQAAARLEDLARRLSPGDARRRAS